MMWQLVKVVSVIEAGVEARGAVLGPDLLRWQFNFLPMIVVAFCCVQGYKTGAILLKHIGVAFREERSESGREGGIGKEGWREGRKGGLDHLLSQ